MSNRRDSKDRESRPKVQEIVIFAEFCSNGVEVRNFIGQSTHGHSYCMMIMTMCCRLLPSPFKASLVNSWRIYSTGSQRFSSDILKGLKILKSLLTSSACDSRTEKCPFFLQMGRVIRSVFHECFRKGWNNWHITITHNNPSTMIASYYN